MKERMKGRVLNIYVERERKERGKKRKRKRREEKSRMDIEKENLGCTHPF